MNEVDYHEDYEDDPHYVSTTIYYHRHLDLVRGTIVCPVCCFEEPARGPIDFFREHYRCLYSFYETEDNQAIQNQHQPDLPGADVNNVVDPNHFQLDVYQPDGQQDDSDIDSDGSESVVSADSEGDGDWWLVALEGMTVERALQLQAECTTNPQSTAGVRFAHACFAWVHSTLGEVETLSGAVTRYIELLQQDDEGERIEEAVQAAQQPRNMDDDLVVEQEVMRDAAGLDALIEARFAAEAADDLQQEQEELDWDGLQHIRARLDKPLKPTDGITDDMTWRQYMCNRTGWKVSN